MTNDIIIVIVIIIIVIAVVVLILTGTHRSTHYWCNMALNSLFCADVPLSNYSLIIGAILTYTNILRGKISHSQLLRIFCSHSSYRALR